MPTTRFEDQPWYPRAKEAIERAVAVQMKRDSAESGTAEREAIEREYEAALAAFRSIGAQVKKDGPTPAAGVGFFRSGLEFVTGGAGADAAPWQTRQEVARRRRSVPHAERGSGAPRSSGLCAPAAPTTVQGTVQMKHCAPNPLTHIEPSFC
jgi:hypothetical protein